MYREIVAPLRAEDPRHASCGKQAALGHVSPDAHAELDNWVLVVLEMPGMRVCLIDRVVVFVGLRISLKGS